MVVKLQKSLTCKHDGIMCWHFISEYNVIQQMEKIIKERFKGKYPVRKSIQTEFAHVGGKEGLQFQVDAVAYCG